MADAVFYPGIVISNTLTQQQMDALFPWMVWKPYAPGRVLVGAGTSDASYALGAEDGTSTVTLESAQVPLVSHRHSYKFVDHIHQMQNHYHGISHDHNIRLYSANWGDTYGAAWNNVQYGSWGNTHVRTSTLGAGMSTANSGGPSNNATTAAVNTANNTWIGGSTQYTEYESASASKAVNKMPPYKVVNHWIRES